MNNSIGLKRAAVLCILQSDRGLLLLHRYKNPHAGKYIPIGGKIEPFETPKAAAIREVKEETGISIGDLRLIGIMTETSPIQYNWINFVFTGEATTLIPGECSEGVVEWIDKEHLNSIAKPEVDGFIYDYVSKNEFFVFDAIYNQNIELIRLVNDLTGAVLLE